MNIDARLSRRSFIRGQIKPPRQHIRPPWSTEISVREHCETCGLCAEQCPEGIIVPDKTGYPQVDFNRGDCTFCKACAKSCPANVFSQTESRPWTLALSLAQGCFAAEGVFCRSCGDACPERAIRFEAKLGGIASLRIDETACTGCGACISVCPRNVLSLTPKAEYEDVAHG